MEIQNNQIKTLFNRWNKVWHNKELPLETRLKAYSILRIIEATVVIYEHNEELDEDTMDDLFLAWNEDFKPLLPEQKPELLKRLREQNKKL